MMGGILQLLSQTFGPTAMLFVISAAIFLVVALIAFVAMNLMTDRNAIRRRLKDKGGKAPNPVGDGGQALTYRRTANRMAERAKKHMAPSDPGEMRKLRAKLVQAGFYDPHAVSLYFLARLLVAVALAAGAALFCWLVVADLKPTSFWITVGAGGALGYLLPQFYLNRRAKQRIESHRTGFPDFMDLMVICADAGLSMEAALQRISQEIRDTHPSLSINLSFASAELRAGSSLNMALENLAARLGVREATSFATLIQQSVELGSSITEALRVYSDDMRHRRLSMAEEKAYSLPAKLSVPLTLCILPVVMVVAMLPIIVRLMGM